ncbi:MAG: LysR family transcriptional regulator substrate-binding protein, partial [Lachnospiraceae bacterium]|nr:LysR family transcriptional regulator substrate-binding protein [Lachnospiraceae bacterium]
SDMTLKYYLLPYLEKFHEQFPGIKVMVTNAPTPETLELLKRGKIDFGVVSTPFDEERFRVKRVREIEDIYVAGGKFIEYRDRILDLKQIEEIPIISLEKNTSTRGYVDAYLKENNVEMHPEFELATSDMIVQFALRNLGVGNVVRDFAREYLQDGSLFELKFGKQIPKRHICVVTEKSCPLSRAAEKFLEITCS